MSAISFDKDTLGNIVRNRRLRVPVNQRSYAWEPEHVKDLLVDLNGAITSRAEEYFLGSIIVVLDGSQIEVFDGQQRLATTMILIAAIRDFIWSELKDQKEAETISNQSLISLERRGMETPHFLLSADDADFFVKSVLRHPDHPDRKSVQPDPKKQSHFRIQEAAREAAKHVASITQQLTAAAQFAFLERWLDFLEKGARVIWVEVANQPTAYRIFETMNDRGLKLSAADLLKNYLYSLAEKRQDEAIQKWQSMASTLESLGKDDGDIVDYIRYLWITTHGHTRSNELFDNIKKEVTSESTAIDFAIALEQRSGDYAALLTPSHNHWNPFHPEIREDIETLRDLGVSQVRPLLLAALGKFSNHEIERLFKNAVNWSVRCLIAGVPSGNLEGYYSKNAKKIRDGLITSVDKLAQEMAIIIPADDRFRLAVKTASVPTASLARYYLRKMQTIADGEKEPQYTPARGKQITLEHVLPRNPGCDWSIAPDTAKGLYNRLGNQALLIGSANSKIGNGGFDAKKPALAASEFTMTKCIAGNAVWGEAEISARGEMLAGYAIKAWPLVV